MSRPLLCDWCREEINEPAHTVKIDNENAMDICTPCLKGVRPKPRIGRPRGKKTKEDAPSVATSAS